MFIKTAMSPFHCRLTLRIQSIYTKQEVFFILLFMQCLMLYLATEGSFYIHNLHKWQTPIPTRVMLRHFSGFLSEVSTSGYRNLQISGSPIQ